MANHSVLTRARSNLILNHPFFATLLLNTPMIEVVNDPATPTMSTDGTSIRYNPEWIESLSMEEVVFVLAHEAMHCVLDHMGRRASRGPNRWNQAADYVINDLLIKDRVGRMPEGGLHNPALVQKGGGTAEGVYKLLPESDEKKKPGGAGGSMDEVFDSESDHGNKPSTNEGKRRVGNDTRIKVAQARRAAQMQGKLSAGLERLVEDISKPKVDWRRVLRQFLTVRAKIEPTFARPKRRFLGEDLYLPSLNGEKMGKVVVAVDCSGSVDDTLLSAFSSEINAIREDLRPSNLTIVYFDDGVLIDKVQEIKEGEKVQLKAYGGGGTDFAPAIDFVRNMPEEPVALVVLTDLVCGSFGVAPHFPVLWCVLEKAYPGYDKVPYGMLLEVTSDE